MSWAGWLLFRGLDTLAGRLFLGARSWVCVVELQAVLGVVCALVTAVCLSQSGLQVLIALWLLWLCELWWLCIKQCALRGARCGNLGLMGEVWR